MSKNKSLCNVKILLEPHDEPWWKFRILSGFCLGYCSKLMVGRERQRLGR